jgi:hypothetical protein
MCLCILRGRGLKKFWQIYFIASLLENRLKCTPDAAASYCRTCALKKSGGFLINKQPTPTFQDSMGAVDNNLLRDEDFPYGRQVYVNGQHHTM